MKGWLATGLLFFLLLPVPVLAGRTLTDAQLRELAPAHLASVPVPEPPNLGDFIRDKQAAIILGKALFWDMQAGSDGIQACATCHFHAGADNRSRNQLSPGLLDQTGADPTQFDLTASGGGGPNYILTLMDFPFSLGSNDVVSSQGVYHAQFTGIQPGSAKDLCEPIVDIFSVGGVNVRRVEPRNTPTTINAVFNLRNFWDGRANNVFNGLDPFGLRTNKAYPLDGPDPKGIWVKQADGTLKLEQVALENASLASQAVGPPLSEFEMSCAGRTFPDLGYKMLKLRPLAKQAVHLNDSVLGPYRHSSGKGLNVSYGSLIAKAFQPKYWSSPQYIQGSYRQFEMNFALFWGLAIQLYEATLISDKTRFDYFAMGYNSALSSKEKFGLEVFLKKGRCINCHGGPEFSNAASHLFAEEEELVERMIMGDGGAAVYDNGFYNISARRTLEDVGVGGFDSFANPLSFTLQAVDGPMIDQFQFDPCKFEVGICQSLVPGERVAIDGAFKTPGLRNIDLTGPYMHNGGHANLIQVIEFYDRGGDFANENSEDLDADIVPLGFVPEEESALEAFLKALTDTRVKYEQAPFDHPELFIPNGSVGDENLVQTDISGNAADEIIVLPAIGKYGRSKEGLPPIKGFLQ